MLDSVFSNIYTCMSNIRQYKCSAGLKRKSKLPHKRQHRQYTILKSGGFHYLTAFFIFVLQIASFFNKASEDYSQLSTCLNVCPCFMWSVQVYVRACLLTAMICSYQSIDFCEKKAYIIETVLPNS